MHHHILVNERLTLEDMMSAFTNNIRKIINRNKKYVVNLAVAESVKYGGNVYEFRLDNLGEAEDAEESKKKVAAPINTD
jgi:hypothetical protein